MTNEVFLGIEPFPYGVPLWCIYGSKVWPQIICCKVNNDLPYGPTIWGYSRGKFKTLGIKAAEWCARHDEVRFFDNQDAALEYLKKITTPKKGSW